MNPNTEFSRVYSMEQASNSTFAWNLLNDILSAKDSIRGRFQILDKVERLHKKFIALEDADRFFIVNSLSESNNDTARSFLEKALTSDHSAVVRHEAAFSLGCVGNANSCEMLKDAIQGDTSVLVRHEAIMALSEIGLEGDLNFLENSINDDNEEVLLSRNIAQKRLADRLVKLLPPCNPN